MAERVVMKFGGTSVGSAERINAVAKRVVRHVKKTGDRVAVVVSAMSGETDRLVELCRKVAGDGYPAREYHQLLSSGEHLSIALTAMAINREGLQARSLLAHQVGLKTDSVFGQHLIREMDGEKLKSMMSEGIIPVIAGFQGIDDEGDFTTLGRGGSDTTAVAVAAAVKPCRCVIYTDIDGVYTALPSICRGAKKLSHLTYEEMLEMANSGAKILHARSVGLAYRYRVPLSVCSSFNDVPGTEIVEEYEGMENAVVSGITCRTDEAKLTLRNIPDAPGVAANVFKVLGDAEVVVDMIIQSKGEGDKASISCTVSKGDATKAYDALLGLVQMQWPGAGVELDKSVAKLSVVGEGMRTHAGVASKMFEVLASEGINVDMITTSEIKISIAIDEKYSELAVRVLHKAFLGNGE